MSTSQKEVSRPIKRETGDDVPAATTDQDHGYTEEAKHPRRSPKKNSARVKQDRDYDEEEDSEDDDYGEEEMRDFIDDGEVNADAVQEDESSHRERRRKRKKPLAYHLDEEDREVIKENTGIEVKPKNRLKRNAERLNESHDDKAIVKKEIEVRPKQDPAAEVHQIDTTKKRRDEYKAELRRDFYDDLRERDRQINLDKLRQAHEIFGDDDEDLELPNGGIVKEQSADEMQIDSVFNADEIDDPFSTVQDQKMETTDICERLQIRLKSRMKPKPDEIMEEAEWIFDRLMNYNSLTMSSDSDAFESHYKYSQLLRKKDAKAKIIKVLELLRNKLYDIPFIAHYRKYEYAEELDEESIWVIFNLDQEFGKFQRQKRQISDFLKRITSINPTMKLYEEELKFSKTKSALNNFTSLITFLSSYYHDKLQLQIDATQRKKQPLKRDEIQIAKQGGIEQFAAHFSLSWVQFIENIEEKKMTQVPPRPNESPKILAQRFINELYPTETLVHQGVCKFAAIELSAQPLIRNKMKENISEHGYITTELTEQGRKDLDLFHPSYRVKCVNGLPLTTLRNQNDLYLDILQCEKAGLITVNIAVDPTKQANFKNFLMGLYMQDPESEADQWNILRTEIIKTLVDKILIRELIKEIREEIKEEAEDYVIAKAKEVYRRLLMTGPFTTKTGSEDYQDQQEDTRKSGHKQDNEIVKDRERNNVMGVIMHQIDANNYVVTVAVVNKYGELVQTRDFMRLLAPRKRRDQNRDQPDDGRPLPKTDEEQQHEKDKKKFTELLEEYRVDLITVAANCLEARNLKRVLVSIASELKNKVVTQDEEPRGKRGQPEPAVRKEVMTIWGSTEVPKLFSMSHNSQRMHKNVQQMYKQAISLARFEQDPLCEVLNLWSPITAENQALALNLDPMQKWVNQSRLAEGLEEVNIQVVNEIGVDINLVCEHEHMHSMLQFVSGFGPRKAKKFISKVKGLGKKMTTRSEIIKQELIGQEVYMSCIAFMKIRVPDEDLAPGMANNFHILDQTRIHHESYKLAVKVANDACQDQDGHNDKNQQFHQLREIMANPARLKTLDLQTYYNEMMKNNQQHLKLLIEKIIDELGKPFGDPRESRSAQRQNMSNERLFYLLIEESKRTFKRGLIVTATVTKVFDSKAIARLDNGLSAIVQSSAVLDEGSNERLKDILDFGRIIQGRIEKIVIDEETKFEVQLTCKKNALSSHEFYKHDLANSLGIDPEKIQPEDLRNNNFSVDQRPKQTGRFIPRRIAHEKFKNISSRRAISELNLLETGDFFFRPSTRSEDRITLTWKFWKNHYVHIDIHESNKQPGAAIGGILTISNDYKFESLREIVERYIIPCNRLVREVVGHQKFSDAKSFEDLEARLKEEKKEDPSRIPYRFAILPSYPQHIVLSYVPKEKVLKEFIKVRPRGFYFHENNHTPFQALINWFKDNWRTSDYQRTFRRQRSPRVQVKAAPVEQPAQQRPGGSQGGEYMMRGWDGGQGDGDTRMKDERAGKSPNYGVKSEAAVRGGWGDGGADTQMRNWGGGRDSPARGDGGGYGGGEGRGRGAAGGGGSRACFKCNEEGHMARECPNGGGAGGDGERRGGGNCYKCDQPGHIARDCPNQDTRPPRRPMECYKCGKEGHMARECPSAGDGDDRGRGRGGGGGGGNRACFKCNEEGHMARECPTSGGDGDAYKRQRRDPDDGGFSRGGGGGGADDGGYSRGPDAGAADKNNAWSQGGNDNAGGGAWGNNNNSQGGAAGGSQGGW